MASEKQVHGEKVDFLRKHDSWALRAICAYAWDERYEWDFPENWKPLYKPCDYFDQEAIAYQSMKSMRKFSKEDTRIPQLRKQLLFVQLLESVPPGDAELMISAFIHRKLPYPGLGPKVIREAFGITIPTKEQMAELKANVHT
jgi:hypothetical protein